MTHYKLYSLHLGCGEPLDAQYQPAQTQPVTKKQAMKKPVQAKQKQMSRRKRK